MTAEFFVDVPAPFRLDFTVWALRRRAHNEMDRIDDGAWKRVLVAAGKAVEISVTQPGGADGTSLNVTFAGRGSLCNDAVENEIRRIVCRCLGLPVDLENFYRLADRDERLTNLAGRFRGMRPPQFPTVFESLVNAIACQQLSLTVGIHLLNRLSERFGPATPGRGNGTGFPVAETLADVDPDILRSLGFSGSKARAICGLARRVESGELDLEGLHAGGEDDAREVLMAIGGVGRWSTEYALLRGLGRLHVLPGDDVGARNNLRRRYGLEESAGYDEVAELSREWWPYGGVVYFHLLLDALARSGEVTPIGHVARPTSGVRVIDDA